MCLGSSYSRLSQYTAALSRDHTIDSYFAIADNVAAVPNRKFAAELLDTTAFWERGYDALVLEGHPQPQSNVSRVAPETIRRFHELGGVTIHCVGVDDLTPGGLPQLNAFLRHFHIAIDTLHDHDWIIGFDKEASVGSQKEFTIIVDDQYRRGRTQFPDVLAGVSTLAVNNPMHQDINWACKSVLMGNPSTRLVSLDDLLVPDEELDFCRVNELGGFYILISAYLLEDFIVCWQAADNLTFGRQLLGHFLALQGQRNAKLGMRIQKCFLSYNHRDKAFAEKLGKDLVSAGINVWLDQWEVSAGESIIGRVEDGLAACNCLLLVMSPHSVNSNWVQTELRSALTRRLRERSIAIVPLLRQTCDIPLLIQDTKYIDFRRRYKQPFDSLRATIDRLPRPYGSGPKDG